MSLLRSLPRYRLERRSFHLFLSALLIDSFFSFIHQINSRSRRNKRNSLTFFSFVELELWCLFVWVCLLFAEQPSRPLTARAHQTPNQTPLHPTQPPMEQQLRQNLARWTVPLGGPMLFNNPIKPSRPLGRAR